MQNVCRMSLILSLLPLTFLWGCPNDNDDPEPDDDVGVDVENDVLPDLDVDPDADLDVDPDADPVIPEAGTLTFDYSGDIEGSFEASGIPVLDVQGNPAFGSYAVGVAESAEPDAYVIFAFSGDQDPVGELFILVVEELTETGVIDLDPTCEPNENTRCGVGFYAPEVDVTALGNDEDFLSGLEVFYIFIAGELDVKDLQAAQISGTFFGSALLAWELVDNGNGDENGDIELSIIEVSNGAFAVPVIAFEDEEGEM